MIKGKGGQTSGVSLLPVQTSCGFSRRGGPKQYFAIVSTRVPVTTTFFPSLFRIDRQVTVNFASRTLSGSVSIDIISIDTLPDDHLAYIA